MKRRRGEDGVLRAAAWIMPLAIRWPLLVAGLAVALLLGSCVSPQSALNPQGPAAGQIAGLWWVMFAVAVIVFVIVMALLIIGLTRPARLLPPVQRTVGDGRRFVLVAGAIIPAIILSAVMGLAIFALRVLAAPPSPATLTIQVIGHQWWWEVRYPNQNIVTANEIHIPAGQSVLVNVTTADVIHSFWVPELQGKIDTIPGQVNSTWLLAKQPGTFRGQCAEYCGTEHALMAFLVIADSPADFQAWVNRERQPAPVPTDPHLLRGEQVFLGAACVYCHAIQGTNATSNLGPDLTHLGSRQTLAAGTLANSRGNLAGWIINSQALKPGNRMPPMQLNGDDLQAVVDYLESLK